MDLAEHEFSYLRDSAATIQMVVGDARLMLQREAPQGFNILILDAFSSDAIPAHLLTVEALRSRALQVAGVVLVGEPNAQNRAAIERYGRVALLGEMPCLRPLTPEALSSWATANLDPRRDLLEFLR